MDFAEMEFGGTPELTEANELVNVSHNSRNQDIARREKKQPKT
jgi:hypothetical protein